MRTQERVHTPRQLQLKTTLQEKKVEEVEEEDDEQRTKKRQKRTRKHVTRENKIFG